MNENFTNAFNSIVGIEGGFSNNSADLGGPTKFGITQAVAQTNGYTGDMQDMPIEVAQAIYKTKYWDVNNLDRISDISYPIAYEVFDTGVNMGITVPAKFLQRGLNLLSRAGALYESIVVDGKIGNHTLNILGTLGEADLKALLHIMNILQGERYIEICESNETQQAFIRGWLKRTYD